MRPSNPSSRYRQKLRPVGESLEDRSLLSGGAGNTFALVPGTIADPNGTADVKFTITSDLFTRPHNKMTLGIDVAPQQGSTINPLISSVTDQHGDGIPQTFHSIYNPHTPPQLVARGAGSSAVLTPLTGYPHQPNRPADYSATISALNDTQGNFLVGFYLPGDANGDGSVDSQDLGIVRSLLGSTAGDPNYNFSADANRDGKIGKIDLAYTRMNLGVSTKVTPVFTATPALNGGVATTNPVQVSGTGTPGATVVFTNPNTNATEQTTIDPAGSYATNLPLEPGTNTFDVLVTDTFGQTIQGQLSPITYMPKM